MSNSNLEARVHYERQLWGQPACGPIDGQAFLMTREVDKVTCGACQRTRLFREDAEDRIPQGRW